MKALATDLLRDSVCAPLPPPLKWAGGKRWLVPTLARIFAPYRSLRLVEPFVGGMAVALGLRPTRALLNDSNPHLINFYQQIRDHLVIKETELRNERDFFFSQRARFNQCIERGQSNTAEAAILFYYLNRTGFNGLCRFNSKGFFNVPFGRHKTIPYLKDFTEYQDLFRSWDFSSVDFELLSIKPDDFLYVDPPYDVEFTKYGQDDFAWKDQERLVRWLCRYQNPMVISNQATDRIVTLYEHAGFSIQRISAPRRISCTGDREQALELLAYKNIPAPVSDNE